MTKKSNLLLKGLNLLCWLLFIGLCIEAGALVFNFVFSLFQPLASYNVYNGLNLHEVYQNQFVHFVGLMSFICVIALIKAYVFYLLVKIFMTLNLVKPFTSQIADLIQQISLQAFSIALLSTIALQYSKRLIQSGIEISGVQTYYNDSTAFYMMAAIVFVISQIFKSGIELQNENDLTV